MGPCLRRRNSFEDALLLLAPASVQAAVARKDALDAMEDEAKRAAALQARGRLGGGFNGTARN